jgi:hypothetical protein
VPRIMSKGLFLKHIMILLCLGSMLSFGAGICLGQNQPPVFDPHADCYVSVPDGEDWQLQGGHVEGGIYTTCYVREGEMLEVDVHATDADGDSVSISVLNSPPKALFEDAGDGRASLFWTPEFVGPFSSAQSPFELFFVATDGKSSSQLRVLTNVINLNRKPGLVLPEYSQVAAGYRLTFQVRAEDPDLEEVWIEALNLPPEASFDLSSGMFDWKPQPADTGMWSITFKAIDLSGGSSFKEARVRVLPPATFGLNLGMVESLLGGVVSIPINLANSESIAGMELLIRFDPTVFTFLGISRQGARTQGWEYFFCKEKPLGLYRVVKILGIADIPNQVSVSPLLPDSGAVAYMSFRVTSDPYLNGLLIPLEFFSFDFTDNTLSTPRGLFITQERINLNNGGVLLDAGNTRMGDVNENGFPFEVGDAVKLAAYLSGTAKLTEQQLINSDVNQDGHWATLSDLVFLINQILQQGGAPRNDEITPGEEVVIRITDEELRTSIRLESDVPVGGAWVIFEGENAKVDNIKLSPQAQDLDIYTRQAGNQFRVLVIGQQGEALPTGEGYLFSFEGEGIDTIYTSLSDQNGELLSVKQEHESGLLPASYTLCQNFPNPFNPVTNIRYMVKGEGVVRVSLRVYNVAGQLVKTLVDDEKSTGEYEVTWNGRNENNQEVASGIYFYKLKVSEFVETKKMVLLK